MNRSLNVFVLVLAGLSGICAARENPDPLDLESDRCLQAASTTLAMLECKTTAYQAWDDRLNKVYLRVRGHLDAEGKKELQTAQREWLKFRDAESRWTDNAYLKMQGTIHRLSAASARVEVVRQRVLLLEEFLGIVEEKH